MSRSRALPPFGATLAASLLLAFALRIAWPLADPPEGMSWSTGSYTDPPANVLAARYAVEGGAGQRIVVAEERIYPALNWVARAAYEMFGPQRIATVIAAAVLGTALCALLALLARRIAGDRAGIITAVLAAVSAWFAPDSRILMAEGVAVVLLAGAALAGTWRHGRALASAGALAAGAGFFGKYNALAFLPALLIFVARRDGWRGAALVTAGAGLVTAAWLVWIFLPNSEEILQWLQQSSPAIAMSYDQSFTDWILSPFTALYQSWLVPRMPIVVPVALWFIVQRLTRPPSDASTLVALWALATFVGTCLLPYRAPRYFMFVAAPLVVAAACQIAEWLSSKRDGDARRMGVLRKMIFATFLTFAAIETATRVEGGLRSRFFLESWVRDPDRDWSLSYLHGWLGGLEAQTALSVAIAGAAVLVLQHPRMSRVRLRGPALAKVVLGLAVAIDLGRWIDWAAHRSTTIESTKRSLAAMVGTDAVVLGGFAPLLTEGTGIVAHANFGRLDPEDLRRDPPVTHLLVTGPDPDESLEGIPDIQARLDLVQRWPLRATRAKSILLLRLPAPEIPANYRRSAFEDAVLALEAGQVDEARKQIAAYRATGAPTADVDLFEGIVHRMDGHVDASRAAFERSAAANPADALPITLLAILAEAEGNASEAARRWMQVVALDPEDVQAVEQADVWLRQAGRTP